MTPSSRTAPGLRVGVVGLEHESNLYAPITPLEAFRRQHGEDAVRAVHAGVGSSVGGYLDAFGERAVPLYAARAEPSGPIAAEAWAVLARELVDAVRSAGPLDALAVSLHGAAIAADVEDPELALIRELRAVVGDGTPIGATFDLHGNLSDALLDELDVAVPVLEYPHTDFRERAILTASILDRLLDGAPPVTTASVQLPLLLPPTVTTAGIGAELHSLLDATRERFALLDCSAFHGFPYADSERVGVRIMATGAGDPADAAAAVESVARWLWERREPLTAPGLDARGTVAAIAELRPAGRVVVGEGSDNPGGGAPGDGTRLLRALLDDAVSGACLSSIRDPETVAAAVAAGIGASLRVRLGGKSDRLHGSPIETEAEVVALARGRVRLQAVLEGLDVDYGDCAVLRIGGVDVVVSSLPWQTLCPALIERMGLDPASYEVIAVKSSGHFRAGFAELADAVLVCDGDPGLVTRNVAACPRSVTAALHPVDRTLAWSPRARLHVAAR